MNGRTNFDFSEPLVFELGSSGRSGLDLPASEYSEADVLKMLGTHARPDYERVQLPECSEPEINRHFTRLSRWNFSIDTNSYPLGSCTMKYNPRINEWAARLPGLSELHPYLPESRLQNALKLMFELQTYLAEIGGFERVSLQPAAGAHGEFAGIAMIHAALKKRGESRTKVLIPKSAHGTNPATAAFFGYEVVPIESGPDGLIDMQDFQQKADGKCAAIMITNPNTLGLFEKDISAISHRMHELGAFVYGDGANLNALMGICRPGDCGIDAMHFNLHKTFTTPHGGGGPGCGAVGVSKALSAYLPTPLVIQKQDGLYAFDSEQPDSIGRIRSFYGNFGMMIRAYTYIRELGALGLKNASERAVLNANYVRAKLQTLYKLPYETDCLHEVVFTHPHTQDIAKGLIDRGVHPPTVFFPLIVSGALMVEPTETESKEELDRLCEAFAEVFHEQQVQRTLRPMNTALSRLNETAAARNPILTYLEKSI